MTRMLMLLQMVELTGGIIAFILSYIESIATLRLKHLHTWSLLLCLAMQQLVR